MKWLWNERIGEFPETKTLLTSLNYGFSQKVNIKQRKAEWSSYLQLGNELRDGAYQEKQIQKELELIEETNRQKRDEVVFLIVYFVWAELGGFASR